MGISQKVIAEKIGISGAHLSDVLNGKVEPGKSTAKKMAKITGQQWTDFFNMKPHEIRAVLFEAAAQQIGS